MEAAQRGAWRSSRWKSLLTVPPHQAHRNVYGHRRCDLWSHRAWETPVPKLQNTEKW